jgi:hypothetical protein
MQTPKEVVTFALNGDRKLNKLQVCIYPFYVEYLTKATKEAINTG